MMRETLKTSTDCDEIQCRGSLSYISENCQIFVYYLHIHQRCTIFPNESYPMSNIISSVSNCLHSLHSIDAINKQTQVHIKIRTYVISQDITFLEVGLRVYRWWLVNNQVLESLNSQTLLHLELGTNRCHNRILQSIHCEMAV